MRGALVAIMFLAACGGSGVDLEVTYGEHFDHVEVFIGNAECVTTDPDTQQQTACPGVAWMTGQVRPPGDVYVMKGDEKIISIDTIKNGTATIHLEATEAYRQPPVIAAVAFDGDTAVAFGTIWGARIPANSAEHWKIALDTAAPASDKIKVAPADSEPDKRVHAWARERVPNPAEFSRCLAMQVWSGDDHVWKSTFIVPETDTDCDGQTTECDPFFTDYNVSGSPRVCVTPAETIAQMPCAIGGSRCADGLSDSWDCMLPADGLTCVPQAVCSACDGSDSTVACLIDTFGTLPPDPGLTVFQCPFHPTDGGATCGNTDASNTDVLVLPVPCKDVEARDLATPLMSSSSPHTANIGNAGMASVDLTVQTSATDCYITAHWNDGTVDTTAGATGKTFIFVVTSNTTGNQIAFPVHFEFSGPASACTGPSTATPCTPLGTNVQTDTMYQCLR